MAGVPIPPDTNITGRDSPVVSVLAGLAIHYHHVTAVGMLLTLNTAVLGYCAQCSPCIVKPQL
jgi:hypothetical protein